MLRGDPKVEALLVERHPELVFVAESCGAGGKPSTTLEKAREAARGWFERGLKGSNKHGGAQRTVLCNQLLKTLKAHSAWLVAVEGATEPVRLERLLERGPAQEEGPLICSLLSQELEGSRYEGLWISRQGPGQYFLGDDHEGSGLPRVDQDGARIYPRVRVMVKVNNSRLEIDGFFHEGDEKQLNPARVPIGPFLTVYFEGVSLKEALLRWKGGPPRNGGSQAAAGSRVVAAPVGGSAAGGSAAGGNSSNLRALESKLPPGWELRESRSKKGVYYYANPSKGLSQMVRPTA